MKSTPRVLFFTLISFVLYYVLDEMYFYEVRQWIIDFTGIRSLSHILAYLLFGLPIFAGTILLVKRPNFFETLGLSKSLTEGIGFSYLFTLPMFLGYALFFDFNSELTFNNIAIGAVSAGFFEELYFRAFLFGMLYRYSRLGFLPSVIIGALLFGLVHLYQSHDMGTLVGIFLTTFMGAILFAWLYSEWKFNLWIPVFLHLFMNLSWMMFSVSDNAFGNLWGNVFRYSTVALAIIFTIFYKKRRGESMEISRQTIWMKKGISEA